MIGSRKNYKLKVCVPSSTTHSK